MMRWWPVVLGLVLSMVSPLVVCAGPYLAAGDCLGPSMATWDCASNVGTPVRLAGQVVAPMTSALIGAESIVDFGFPQGPSGVPDWWRIGDGACRPASQLQVVHGVSICPSSFDEWASYVTTTFRLVLGPADPVGDPFGSIPPNHARLYISSRIDESVAAEVAPLDPFEPIHLFTVRMGRTLSTGPGACSGCGARVCAMILRTTLNQRGAPDIVIDYDVGDGAMALQGGYQRFMQCFDEYPDATTRSTWGQVKSLYR
jgi:hypothetical protein